MKPFSRLTQPTSASLDEVANPPGSSYPTFESLLPKTAERRSQLWRFVQEVNMQGGIYHKMNFGGGIIINGEFDMAKYLDNYGLPQDLQGKSVLDVGTGSGFFAFECARRGGHVTAIDVWDSFFFDRIRGYLGLDIQYLRNSIDDLNETLGKFDIVLCGSVLLHVRDIFGAIEKIRSLCKRDAIIATAAMEDGGCDHRACCEFVGIKTVGPGGEYWVYWHVNTLGLKKMLLAAGFSEACEVAQFVLKSEPGKSSFAVPHIVVKASV